MTLEMDNTVIDFDNLDLFPINMESVLSDDPEEDFKRFLDEFSGENPTVSVDSSLYENLFTVPSVPPSQETLQQLSPSPPVPSPPSTNITPITNFIRIPSFTPQLANGMRIIQCEPKNPNRTITIIKTSKPITLSTPSTSALPITTNDSVLKPINSITPPPPPPTKRRRSDSSSEQQQQQLWEVPSATIEQLKLQYGNLSDEALKKHIRMIKNRESASLSRKRRKELMENLDVTNKQLKDENEQLKQENSKLLIRIHTLEMENKLLKQYSIGNPPARKPLILMGIVLLVIFAPFALKSRAPISNDLSNSIELYNNEAAVIPSRTILSNSRSMSQNSYSTNSDYDYGPNGNTNMPAYPYIQCVAYINKTHSQRINQDLRSWVQDHSEKQQNTQPVIIPDPKSLTIKSNSVVEPLHHTTRKVARQTKIQTDNKGQLQPYKTYEANYDDFIHSLDRKNDTLYFVSFKRDHLILPANIQNQTQRPKMSLILPASMANLNKSIHVPTNHVPMIKIDCEVEDTKLVFVKRTHIPSSYRNDLFEYYSSVSQTTI
ncbi:hypothetical protein I4U23_000519 [Adineta vaga]|nr:hypothetical protein I4U23_000519 [Adineta vaga]